MKNPMRHTLLTVMVILLVCAGNLFGQGFWTKKPYPEWSEKEVKSMLNDSPWSWRLDIS